MVWQWQRRRSHRVGRGRTRKRLSGHVIGRPALSAQVADSTARVAADSGSHGPPVDGAFMSGLRPIPMVKPGENGEARPGVDISGVDPSGSPVRIQIGQFDRSVLLAFLHIRCDGCEEYWRGFRDAERAWPRSVSPVVVTRGPETVDPVEVGRAALGYGQVPVVMGDEAWTDYRVPTYPFFVVVDVTSRTIIGETVGLGWDDVISMIRSAGL